MGAKIEVMFGCKEIDESISEARQIESRDAGLRLHRSPDLSDTPSVAEIGPADSNAPRIPPSRLMLSMRP